MKYFALINNNLVESIIVADDDFLVNIKDQYESIIDVTDIDRPSPGDSYYNDTFVSNSLVLIDAPVDLGEDHLQGGPDSGFDPIQLSQYTVSCSDGIVTMGCKQLTAASLLDALHKILIDDAENVADYKASDEGPGHGKYNITWDDAQVLYDALLKVKL